jgi:dihydroorotase/allantoinase
MTKLDIVIKNGTVYLPTGLSKVGVAIEGEKIVMIAKDTSLPDADTTIDATGKLVLPGIIDVHLHVYEPGFEWKEDYVTASKASAASGTTLIMPQPSQLDPVASTVPNYMKQIELAEKRSIVDFAPTATPMLYEEGWVPKLAKLGIPYFKVYHKSGWAPYVTEATTRDSAKIFRAWQAVAKTGLYCAIHPCNSDILEYRLREVETAGKGNNVTAWWGAQYSEEELASDVYQLYYFAKKSGVRWLQIHCFHKDTLDWIRRMRSFGDVEVKAEVETLGAFNPTREEAGEWYYPVAQAEPEKRRKENFKAVLEAVNDGTIDIIGSDNAPSSVEKIKKAFKEGKPRDVMGHWSACDWHLQFWLNEVNKGAISLKSLVKVASENPARIFRLYPRKGAIMVGSDADITIVDMKKEGVMTADRMYCKQGAEGHWCAFEGRKYKGETTHTILRGTLVAENREILVKPGYGKWVKCPYT